jgi:murein L,D-transpeptidase YafK
LRALLSSAAFAAAIALAGCNPDMVPSGRAQAPLSEKTLAEIASKNMEKDSPILIRIFKEESEMEVWKKNRDGDFALLKTYPICRWSGGLGPKKKEGDRQAPEGFYTITPGQMNPNSNYYLAFNTGFPNAYDRSHGYTGSELMVHGDCSSRGCYAMTDEQIQEIYALARESFFGGQKAFQLQAYPFRMTAMNMAKHRNNPHFAFWKMIKEGYDDFEATRHEPKVNVCEKRYVFDAAPPDNASRPISFNARGKCPVYQLDKTVADAVLEHRRQEQIKMAQYIADNVTTVPIQKGVDGGMNPVFVAKLSTHAEFDNNGHMYAVAGNSMAPGALPRTPNPPATAAQRLQVAQLSKPKVVASVPMPHPAPRPKEGEAPPEQKPTTIASLLGNLFGGSRAQAEEPAPATAESETSSSQVSNTGSAAKPKHTSPERTATAPVVLHPKSHKGAAPKAAAANPHAPPAKPDAAASASPWPAPEKPKAVATASPWPTQAKPKAVATASPWPDVPPANNAAPDKPKPATVASKAPPSHAQRAAKPEKRPAVELRTAYAPPASTNGLLSGAQPVVPAGSFSALR